MEMRFQRKNVTRLLPEYCWLIRRHTNPYLYKRSNKKPKLFQFLLPIKQFLEIRRCHQCFETRAHRHLRETLNSIFKWDIRKQCPILPYQNLFSYSRKKEPYSHSRTFILTT